MTGFQPTRMPGAPSVSGSPQADTPCLRPTTIGGGVVSAVPAVEPSPALAPAPITITQLPGIVRQGLQVSPGKLAEKFPGESEEMLKAVAHRLADIVPDTLSVALCLQLGEAEQEAANALLNRRLEIAAKGVARPVLAHLSRLRTVLSDQLEAVDRVGLFQRRTLRARWDHVWPELKRIRAAIEAGMPAMRGYLADLDTLKSEADDQGRHVRCSELALAWLADTVSPDLRDVLRVRQAALQYSAAMLIEQVQWLGLEYQQATTLTLLLQDGVLNQLPAVHLVMASLPDTPDETQKFIAVEKLMALKTILNGG